MTRLSRRASKRATVATLVVMSALTACGTTSHHGVDAGAGGSYVPFGSTASASAEPNPSASSSAAPAAPPVPPKPATTNHAPAQLPGVSAAAQAVLDQVNGWRTAAGLRPYVMVPGLVASAHKHNLTMAAGCGLSHQCRGERPFGDRIHAEGVNWSSAGENCGVGGGVTGTTTAITGSAKSLDQGMFNEKPPGDGHRRNLLSTSFTHIGIDVVRDSKGNVWLTEDFTS